MKVAAEGEGGGCVGKGSNVVEEGVVVNEDVCNVIELDNSYWST